MSIAVLLFSETTIEKLARHAITPEEVRQVNDGGRIVIRNPRPPVVGSLLMIGPTHGGRILTVVLNPEPAHPVRLYIAVDPETLHELEQRASAQGTDLYAAAASALRAGAHAA